MTKRFFILLSATALVIAQAMTVETVRAGQHRQHEVHEHGVAHLNVAVEGSNLTIELFSPAANIVGFEHLPQTQAQKDQVEEARKKLEAGQTLFQLPAQAQARLVRSVVDTDIDNDSADALQHHEQAGAHDEDEKTGHDFHNDGHVHERHSDFNPQGYCCIRPVQFLTLCAFTQFCIYRCRF